MSHFTLVQLKVWFNIPLSAKCSLLMNGGAINLSSLSINIAIGPHASSPTSPSLEHTGRYLPCIYTYCLFSLCSTHSGTVVIPSPNTYISYNQPKSQFLKGGSHNPTGGYVLWNSPSAPYLISLILSTMPLSSY